MNILYLLFLLSSNSIYAHISMSNPPSRRNAGSSYYTSQGLVNYNLRSPLNVSPDFFKFPCKGFSQGPSVSTFQGNKISVTLEGTATHGGGHCQFGVSYDNSNFLVLKTVLNSCLLDSMTYDFDLPEDAPGGKMTIFWSWVNRVGNREYYMECSDVTVNNGNSPNKKTTLKGTELLVVNLPGYSTVPEWNPGDSPDKDGRNLFFSRREISMVVNNGNSQINNQQKQEWERPKQEWERPKQELEKPKQEFEKQKHELEKLKQELEKLRQELANPKPEWEKFKKILPEQKKGFGCDRVGQMKCNGSGFDTCVHNTWVYRSCGAGTGCKQLGESIICDYI